MIDLNEIIEIKKITEELLQKMTITDSILGVAIEESGKKTNYNNIADVVLVNVTLKEPQFLIGRDGQTLFDLQRVLGIVLNRRLKKSFYVKLDINDYQKQKTEYLKNLAASLANEVVLSKEKRFLPPMPAHERRIIHEELSKRQDVTTQSQGDGDERHIIVNLK